jgi:hypothetical protein
VGVAIFARVGIAQELMVEAEVAPSISVSSYTARVNIGTISTGDFSGTFTFAIEANTANVSLQVMATDLYKDSNPSTPGVKPISINRAAGVDIHASAANLVDHSGWNAPFSSNEPFNKPEGIFNGHKTQEIKLESKQKGIFNQDVDLRVTWTQEDATKPAGRYGGYIVLYVSMIK